MTHRIAGLFELVIWSVLLNILFGLALWAVARRLTRDRLGALGMCLLMASVLTLILGRLASDPEPIEGEVLYYGSLALAGGALIYYSRWRTRAEQRARAEQLARRRARKSAEK